MTTVTVTLSSLCAGNGHLHFAVTGDLTLTRTLLLEEISEPIRPEQVDDLLKLVIRMAKNGRTVAQARTLLQTGVTLVI